MITNKTSLLLVTLLLGCSAVAFAGPTDEQAAEFHKSGLNNAGVAANRAIEYMERQRVAKQIAEDKAKASSKVEQGSEKPDAEQQAAVTFKLEKLELDESTVLEQAELQKLTDEYIGKEVGVKDLYELVNKINKLYLDNGYFTCRAILPAQTIKNGTVKIELIEGKTNAVEVQGNKYTKSKYISKR
ncbi:POTRA domain-containing protein, partial [Phascolarctobacterium succinatutens]